MARTLRREGFAGPVVLIGNEPHCPYERPPLSKAFLHGAADAASMTLLSAAEAAGLAIDLRRNQHVVSIDRTHRLVRCADGSALPYATLFLTTGGTVRTLPGLGVHPRIHTLRTQDDATRLRAALQPGSRLLVLGGGWIGLEVAATARAMGVAVTLLEAGDRLCARSMPPVVSDFLHRLHTEKGVALRMGVALTDLHPHAAGVTAVTADGATLHADHALIGIGITPDTGLAAACGLAVADGILVDAQGRTSDPSIFAAGDVARQAGAPHRLESWANAQNGAIAAARAALGQDARHDEIPWFWSDQHGVNLQVIGHPAAAARAIARGSPETGAGCWLMLDAQGRALGAVAVNAPRELRTLRKMLSGGTQPDPGAWADPTRPLAQVPAIPLAATLAA